MDVWMPSHCPQLAAMQLAMIQITAETLAAGMPHPRVYCTKYCTNNDICYVYMYDNERLRGIRLCLFQLQLLHKLVTFRGCSYAHIMACTLAINATTIAATQAVG